MNILSAEKIREKLKSEYKEIGISVFECIDSTNDEAKRQWKKNITATAIFVSDKQTAGRGRRGRSFYSPGGTGIYMSLLLQPKSGLEDAVHITTATAVVVAKALKQYLGAEVGIKWVNDLYFKNKKVCGILTEAVMEANPAETLAVVVGIGINLSTEVFPEELQGIAGGFGVEADAVERNELVASIVNGLLDFAKDLKDCSFVDEYREMSVVLGKEIRYNEGDALIRARALDIDSEGGLMVELADGSVKVLKTGEITVRLEE